MVTNDNFGNADVVYPLTLPTKAKEKNSEQAKTKKKTVVTGFLGRGQQTGGSRTS